MYNDFQILNDDTYALMRDKFGNLSPFNRRDCTYKICSYLNACVNSCLNIKPVYNKNLISQINSTNEEIKKIFSSLVESFNVEASSNITHDFNLFKFIKFLILISLEFNTWYEKEEKEYYKKMCTNFSKTILNCVTKILDALTSSNIQFYKYM